MSAIEIVGGIIILLCAVIIIVTVTMMEGKGGGMNALSGSNESSYLGKNKSRSMQATLSRIAKFSGIVFVGTTLVVYFISAAMK